MEKTIKICRPYITVKGVRKYAKDQGLKAFCWDVSIEKHQAFLEEKAQEKQKSEPNKVDKK
ncbi:hypothetical protein DCE79_16715 [Lysinibacillus sp. 2017]|uniref:hypothetical protein n=1 Tax=unclassified Lysinibacillus TaxID=2636778 RepID=UPI000D527D3D|nr:MULTISPECIES: hypothetical protein [unclassified Lysinibacillus]AWE08886.1 hypothetical protein DCE79_16715 [Lysinibacillus sp. 2017]TGN34730.1 hypothetical protein E4L99_13200 [Lysinibacillus sp. S2017]